MSVVSLGHCDHETVTIHVFELKCGIGLDFSFEVPKGFPLFYRSRKGKYLTLQISHSAFLWFEEKLFAVSAFLEKV
jgi:hypothetical protein